MKMRLRCFLMALVALGLMGCGMKGPLYMPVEQPRVEQLPALSDEPEELRQLEQQQEVAEK